MPQLSVNINKIALLRNARGRNFPDVRAFGERCLELGAHGISVHPRPDQRRALLSDVSELQMICVEHGAELNVEGYPSPEFMATVMATRPAQCTLVPDAPGQLTSDHGWNLRSHAPLLEQAIGQLKSRGIRVSVLIEHDTQRVEVVRKLGADRVKLYMEPYAAAFAAGRSKTLLPAFKATARSAVAAGLGVNAGHDLNLENLPALIAAVDVLEVSIGHALVVECLESGLSEVLRRYLKILAGAK